MHMKNVEVVTGNYFRHLGREDEIIGRIFKEWIRQDFHFMKCDSIRNGQSHRQRIADEVDVVTSRRKLFSEFGGDDPASAIRWITRDANSQSSTT